MQCAAFITFSKMPYKLYVAYQILLSRAAQRATPQEIDALRSALLAIETLAKAGQDAAAADFAFHMQIARATRNAYLVRVLEQLDPATLLRARLDPGRYLSRVNSEHNDVFEIQEAERKSHGRS